MGSRTRGALLVLVLLGLSLQLVTPHAHFETVSGSAEQVEIAAGHAAAAPASLHDAATCFACRSGKDRQRLAVASASFVEDGEPEALSTVWANAPSEPVGPARPAGGARAPPARFHFELG